MLSRLRSLLSPPVSAVAQAQPQPVMRGRVSNFRKARVIPPPPVQPTTVVVPSAGAAGGSGASGSSSNKFDATKLMRTGFLVLGTGFFLSRFLTDPNNPDSLVNRAMNPRGKGKYVLKVEKMDDTIAGYNSSFIGASQGVKPALQSQSRYQLAKRIGVEVCIFYIDSTISCADFHMCNS